MLSVGAPRLGREDVASERYTWPGIVGISDSPGVKGHKLSSDTFVHMVETGSDVPEH